MFERIVLRTSERGSPISFGEIAEALIFYERVHLVLDMASITSLLKSVGAENFFRLIEHQRVSSVYIDQTLGTLTQQGPFIVAHSYVAFSLQGRETRLLSRKQRTAQIFARAGFDKQRSARYAERFLRSAKCRSVLNDDFIPGGVIEAAKADLRDESFILAAVKGWVRRGLPSHIMAPEFSFAVYDCGKHFEVQSDLDMQWLASFREGDGAAGELTHANFLSEVLTARADMALASHYGCDFRTSSSSSEVLRLRHENILRRSGISASEVQEFRDVVLPEMPSVREVFDAGLRRPEEFFTLIDASRKFAAWASGLTPDEKLVGEYLRAATSAGWISGLQGKTMRFVIGGAIGVANPVAGFAASLADTFLLDRIFGGWRPSHFVERNLKPFISEAS